MPKSLCVVAAWLLLLLVSAGGEARGQVFRYVDEEGRVHFTDGSGAIPPKYRDQLEGRATPERASSVHGSSSPSSPRRRPADSAEPDGVERLFADAFIYIAEQEGESMTTVERRAVEGWAADWAWAGLWASAISSLVIMGMVVHAFIADRKMWGLAHFFIGFTAIPYLFMYVEKPLVVRIGLLLGLCSPVPVFYALFSRLIATV